MGTRLWLCTLRDDTVRLLINNPARIDSTIERVAKPPVRDFSPVLRLIRGLLKRQSAATEGDNMDIDKAWHGIHFLLTGTAWGGKPPLDFILAGGTEVEGYEDGAARLYSPGQLREINQALKAVDPLNLKAAYDPAAMMNLEIYPSIWERDAQALDYCMQHFTRLKDFVASAGQGGLGMLTTLS